MGKIEIIPAINEHSFEEILQKIRRVEERLMPLADGPRWIHIDVADGTFTKNTIWHNVQDLSRLHTALRIEMHLMVQGIDKKMRDWLHPAVHRNIFHLEAAAHPDAVIDWCHEKNIEAGIAINPETSWETAHPFFKKADLIQTLAVRPGVAGQQFQETVYEKIQKIQEACPLCVIEVDGGMKVGVARQCVQNGAHRLVASSAIFKHSDIQEAYKLLREDANL